MTPHSTPSFFTSPPIALPSTPVSFFCARPNMYDHWIASNCIKFQSVPSKLIILQIYDIHCSTELASCFVRISKSLIAIASWWMLDFIDLLHFYRSQPLMGRRHLRVNQQGRLVVESFCRRCRFECHGAQWCGLAGSSRISRLQAWCCAFRRSSVAGGGWIWVYMRLIGCSLWGVGGIVGWLVGQSGWKWRSDKALETWGAPLLVATTCAPVSSWDLPWLLLHAGEGGGQVQAFSSGDPHQTG